MQRVYFPSLIKVFPFTLKIQKKVLSLTKEDLVFVKRVSCLDDKQVLFLTKAYLVGLQRRS